MELDLKPVNDVDFFLFRGLVLNHFADELEPYGWARKDSLSHGLCFLDQRNTHRLIVDGVTVGWVQFNVIGLAVLLQYLMIKPEFRKRGLGEMALKTIGEMYRGKTIQSFYYGHNEASRKLHEKLGFRPVGTVVQNRDL